MDKDTRKSKGLERGKRKRKSTYQKDEKKSRGKQKKKDHPIENSEEPNQSKEKESETASISRPASPEPNCSICLGDLQNKSFTDSCFHMFCFVCLKEWSKVKAECPLCKQKFQNIIYNVKSYDKYDRYNIAEEEATRNQWDRDGTRFRYRTTLTFERRLTFAPEHNYTQPIGRPSSVTTRSHWQRYREPATSEFRRRLYNNGMRAAEITDRRLRVRDVTPSFYRRNPATTHRLVPWLNRELNSILFNQPDHVQLVMEIIMGLIKTYAIDSEEFYQHIYPYVGRHTRHFMHEFLCFAKSPYNMATYDSHVIYQPGALTINSDSDDTSVDDDDVDEIIDIEDDNLEEIVGGSRNAFDSPERRGNTLNENLSPLFRSVRDILETESPGSSLHCPVSMSGWDSPTPGPSWMSLVPDMEVPSSSMRESLPVIGNRASSPIDIGSNSGSETDSTVSADSKGSDIVFVKMDKPWDDRSPIMLSSDNSDDERKTAIDFINKHYSKGKLSAKNKEHKRHRAHKKHKDQHIRENSKEKSKHKKHKSRHSSDKSHGHSHSSSKHRDSARSRSSSKHGDNEGLVSSSSSSSKTLDVDNLKTTLEFLHKDKHKKHKKHKKQEHRKSKSSSKLRSVIVLPTSVNTDVELTGIISSESLFPAAAVMTGKISLPSSSSTTLSSANSSYKKHSSGHKKSSKLIDIVPRLLEKKIDKLESDKEKKENEFIKNGQHSGSNETKSVGAINANEPCIQFQISDDILDLENSKRCLKCGLLYIPELLDNFDICFTCKKKKVCETESRSLSDLINEITKSHANQNLTSTSNGIKDNNDHYLSGGQVKDKPSKLDNIVIQEGDESSLRPAINQVDLTAIDAPLLDTTESDNDDCELILADEGNANNDQSVVLSNQCPTEVFGTQNTLESGNNNPLSIDFSNPSTPIKGPSQSSLKTGSSSPMPWILEVSNPPTPSSNDWPGYMAPRSPGYSLESPPTLESLFPQTLPSFNPLSMDTYRYSNYNQPTNCSNNFMRSSYSPMSCNSSIYVDSQTSKYLKPKPVLIDLETDIVDVENVGKNNSKLISSMSISSSENICLSDSDDSEKSMNIYSDSKVIGDTGLKLNMAQHSSNEFLSCSNRKDVSPKESCVFNKKSDDFFMHKIICRSLRPNTNQEEMELGELVDDDMMSISQWSEDDKKPHDTGISCNEEVLSGDYRQPISIQKKAFSETPVSSTSVLPSVDLQTSNLGPRYVPRSLEEKLAGLTEFSPSVLQGIEKENGLSFHSIISSVKHDNNSSKCSPDSSVSEQTTVQSTTDIQNIHVSSQQTRSSDCVSLVSSTKCSNSLSVNNSNLQTGSLVGNLNGFDVENHSDSNSDSMDSVYSVGHSGTLSNDNSNCISLRSPVVSVTMESDEAEGVVCDSSTYHPLLTFTTSNLDLGPGYSKYTSDRPSVITMGANTSSCSPCNPVDRSTDKNEVSSSRDPDNDFNEEDIEKDIDTSKLITSDDDQQDSSNETQDFIDLHQTEFSSESGLENCLSKDSEDDTDSTIVEYRVDVLHSEKQLSDNFANIFESSDSN